MKTSTELRRELARLDSRYGAAYLKADAQLRSRPITLAWLYAKDIFSIANLSFLTALIGVPVLWFCGAASNMTETQQMLQMPINNAAAWEKMTTIFWLLFMVTAGCMLILGRLGLARIQRTHADAQLFFVQESQTEVSFEFPKTDQDTAPSTTN